MSTDNAEFGKLPTTPETLRQADPDSPDGCEAPPAESGSEGLQGASPSNTAPHNSNNKLPDGFKLLRLAVDSLYLSYPGDLHPKVLARLIDLKGKAQSPHLEEQARAQYVAGNHIFEVKDKGAGLFPFVLDDNAYRIQFSRPGKKLPMAYVKVSAEYLAHKGPRPVQEELEAYYQGLEVDELLIQRVAARSRLFNAGVNFQGEQPEEPEESEGVKAYRKASRGE